MKAGHDCRRSGAAWNIVNITCIASLLSACMSSGPPLAAYNDHQAHNPWLANKAQISDGAERYARSNTSDLTPAKSITDVTFGLALKELSQPKTDAADHSEPTKSHQAHVGLPPASTIFLSHENGLLPSSADSPADFSSPLQDVIPTPRDSEATQLAMATANRLMENLRGSPKKETPKAYVQTSLDHIDSDVFRLTQQASFGATPELLNEINTMGVERWVEYQLSLPLPNNRGESIDDKTHLARLEEVVYQAEPKRYKRPNHNFRSTKNGLLGSYQMGVWLEKAFYGKDQLRQRTAYALSQLWVTSTAAAPLDVRAEALAAYADLLTTHAFGNYRDFMEAVVWSPAMGIFLSHQGNEKSNPALNTRPDENFAREIQQLFTIGIYQLDRDGHRIKNPDGTWKPAYSQDDVEQLARVMTGIDLVGNQGYGAAFGGVFDGRDFTVPMEFTAEKYERGTKVFHGVELIEDGSYKGPPALPHALDILFNHNNTPFVVSRHMIRRMVTSNPSQAYVQRVAAAFRDNGKGVRGDMGAVVKAVILDPEARSAGSANDGKFREPFITWTSLMRNMQVKAVPGWLSAEGQSMRGVLAWNSAAQQLGQAPLRAESVFNFYEEDYIPNDTEFTMPGMPVFAPEAELQSLQNTINLHNLFWQMIEHRNWQRFQAVSNSSSPQLTHLRAHHGAVMMTDMSREIALFERALDNEQIANGDFANINIRSRDVAGNTPRIRATKILLVWLDKLMFGGNMPSEYATAIIDYTSGISAETPAETVRLIVAEAVYALATSDQYRVLR